MTGFIDEANIALPEQYKELLEASLDIKFDMPSELRTGALLHVLVSSKPCGHFLEIGAGTGLATAFMLDGMDVGSKLVSVDNGARSLSVAKRILGADERIQFICGDGAAFIMAAIRQLLYPLQKDHRLRRNSVYLSSFPLAEPRI